MIYKILEIKKELQLYYKENKLIPFIGSGFSKPLGLPDWKNLIGLLGEQLGYEQDLFFIHGNYQQLADYVKQSHYKIWDEFIHKIITKFDSEESNNKRKKSAQHIKLASLDFKTIYTTNYDCHIEGAFQDQNKKVITFSSLEDFGEYNSLVDNNRELVKFHGTLTRPESIVLTESEYFDRMSLEDAVDQRLRADVLSNNFLFIGYSFNDPNIRYIWYKLHKLRKLQNKSNRIKLKKSFLTGFGINEIQAKLLEEWDIHVITLDPSNKEESVAELLDSIKS